MSFERATIGACLKLGARNSSLMAMTRDRNQQTDEK